MSRPKKGKKPPHACTTVAGIIRVIRKHKQIADANFERAKNLPQDHEWENKCEYAMGQADALYDLLRSIE